MITEKDLNRLWSKIDVRGDEDCWLWTGSVSSGSGRWSPGKSGLSPHATKAVYEVVNSVQVPSTTKLRHSCDSQLCCNPKHLYFDLTPQERFWKRVDKRSDTECWDWQGHIKANGYGEFSLSHDKPIMAHRFSYMTVNSLNELPDKMHIMHSCDRRSCVNPNHLSLGTAKENIRDMINKGRQNFTDPPPQKGSQNCKAKLNEVDIPRIRFMIESGMSNASIAKEFAVSPATIHLIRHKKLWRHV